VHLSSRRSGAFTLPVCAAAPLRRAGGVRVHRRSGALYVRPGRRLGRNVFLRQWSRLREPRVRESS
jgi:hypothetical protein